MSKLHPSLAEADLSGSEALWAEHGLTGLVLFALLAIIVMFIRFNQVKLKEDKVFIERIMSENMAERKDLRAENAKNVDKLAMAIDSLTESIRSTSGIEVHNAD